MPAENERTHSNPLCRDSDEHGTIVHMDARRRSYFTFQPERSMVCVIVPRHMRQAPLPVRLIAYIA